MNPNSTVSSGNFSVQLFIPKQFSDGMENSLECSGTSLRFSACPASPFVLILRSHRGATDIFPQYTLAFHLSDERTLLVSQLQAPVVSGLKEGESNPTRGLGAFDHKQVLLEHSVFYARSIGLQRVGILGAANNPWITERCRFGEHLPLDRAKKIYDETAKRAGFELSAEDGNWYKAI